MRAHFGKKWIDFSGIVFDNKKIAQPAQLRELRTIVQSWRLLWRRKRKRYYHCGRSGGVRVSKTTVSRAISGKGRIGKETRKRVMEYIEEHDYKPNAIAKGLAQSKTYNICVVMPRDYEVVDWNFFQRCLFGIQEMAETVGYDILLTMCQMNDISSLERIVANHKVDGVILMRTFWRMHRLNSCSRKIFRL